MNNINEDIKILEDKDCIWNYPENRILQAIENIVKSYKELEESKITRERVNAIQEETKRIVNEKYIPKSKIKDKIEELEELLKDFEQTDNTGRFKREKSRDYDKLQVLQELLEEE